VDIAKWLSGVGFTDWTVKDMEWLFVTVILSTLLAAGYAVIMFNWYFQSKMGKTIESRASFRRLVCMVMACGICGLFFYLSDMQWLVWRLYDVVLLALVAYTWTFAIQSRGMGHVTDRLSQFAQLERTCARYTEIAELLPQMVWTATADGRVDYANQRWLEYAGDVAIAWPHAVHPDEQPDVTDWWSRTLSGRAAASREIRLKGKNGYRTFLVNATPIVHGHAVKWLGACADIEAQKRLATEKENQAKEKAFFLNALSHDLRAPLNNVVLNAQLMQMISDNPEMNESATVIVDNAIAASNLMSQLLEYARSGSEKNTFTEFSLLSLLQQIERRFAPAVAGKRLRMTLGGGDDADVVVTTDRVKLERIIGNLVDNAVKFTSSGGVTLGVSHGDDGRVSILVSDTGPGVPERHVGHLFDEFYQVGNHERDRHKGFGLGLAICRQLARQLGGDIRLTKTGKDGSCFEVTLRAARHAGGGRPVSPAGHGDHLEAARLCVA
jgi:signal transduction histidine kinase